MAKTRIPSALRSEVIKRAQGRCEYCRVPQEAEWTDYEVDHVIAEQHGGKAEMKNLAYACFDCNRYKGPNLTSIDPQTGEVTRLFNPRTQKWDDHFQLDPNGPILPQTSEGRATARLLRFNDPIRVQQRADLIAAGRFA
jgi:5-methylcytosine-specific restriction endonuclease McrA